MYKRKSSADPDALPEKRTRVSDGASTSGTDLNEIGDDNTETNKDGGSSQSTTTSPYKSFFGKFIPNLSWSKDTTGNSSLTEKGDNSSPKNEGSGCLNSAANLSRLSMSPRKASSVITNCKGTIILDGKVKLKNKWSDDLMDSTSEGYINMAQNYIKEIDDLLRNSNVSKVYMNSVVTKFSQIQNSTRSTRKTSKGPGSVMVHSEMTFHHTYTKLFQDLRELCDNVEDFIILQASLGETDDTSVQIESNADSVTVQEKKIRPTIDNEDEQTLENGVSVNNLGEESANVDDHFVDAEETNERREKEKIDITDKKIENQDIVVVNDDQNEDMTNQVSGETSSEYKEESLTIISSTGMEDRDIEGEQIVVGKEKIPDIVTGEIDIAEMKEESNRRITKRKSPTSKEHLPSGSGLKPKSHHLVETKKDNKESDDDGDVLSEPGTPISVGTTSNSITLKWNRPKRNAKSVDHYEIKYKECKKGKGKWISVLSEGAERTVKVKDLKAEIKYEFKVRAVNEDGEEGPFCQPCVTLSTVSSLAKSLIPMANLIEDGNPKVYKLPVIKQLDTVNKEAKTRKCVFGAAASENLNAREKTIMVIGATGSGKTTLVDGMINYITDVSWDDEFRFSLVDLTDDEKKRKASEAESQTEWITCYTINKLEGSTIDYTLNIIDTPGFGDTRGIVRDKRIVDQIREFFTTPGRQGITCLDAVCFVTQAPLGKLTPPQRYIFDQILSVFGQDIKSNIFVLITFADANEPPVRAALKAANVPYQKSYKFNNSALYASPGNPAEAEMGNLFWKMGKESFKIFFDELKSVESKSLLLTSEVLQVRKQLEVTIQGLQHQIADGMNQLNTIKQEREILKRHKEDIQAKKDFTYEVDEVHMYQVDLEPGVYVTNCMTCNRTCHFPCGIPDDQKKQNCAAMDRGLCTVCPMNCHWTLHKNNNFRFDTYTMKVTKTYDELKKKYEIAQKEAEKHKTVLGKIKIAFTGLGQDVMKMVHDVRCCINKLNDIALRPNPLSDKDYIDLLIESEKSEKRYGWEQRIKLYYKLREEADLVEQMHQQNYQPWNYIDSDESDDFNTDSQDNTDDDRSAGDDDIDALPQEGIIVKEEPDMEVE